MSSHEITIIRLNDLIHTHVELLLFFFFKVIG